MSDQADHDESRRRRLEEVIGSFLVALDAGPTPDPREWLARYPDLSPELADFFADRARMDNLIGPMRIAPEPVHGGRAAGSSLATTSVESVTIDGPGSAGDEDRTAPDDGDSDSRRRATRVRYFGDYALERVLGEGGMGIVYKARQLSLNRPVAVKMIKAARFASTDDLRRFRNEAEAVARLDHPNIVPIFEVGQFEDQHYFSMKLIAGEGLDQRLEEYASQPRRAAGLMAPMAAAIHHAHQRGILHRDLKPANVLIDPEGQPHVTDFGLAKQVEGDSELTQTGAVLGTPAYMAPEQTSAKKGAVTTATDVYGLGTILYAMMTGRAPFGGTTVLEILDQVRQRSPDPPRSLNPRVPRDLEVICLKCLEKEPRRRYASADAMAEDLKRYLAGEPIAARPVGSAARFGMWCRRNPALAAAAGLLVAALVAVALLSLLSADRQARLAAAETRRADEQTRHAGDEARAAARLEAALGESNRRLAALNFERGQVAFERGEIGPGLLWMVESLKKADDARDPAWKQVALANLAARAHRFPRLEGSFTLDRAARQTLFSPDGRLMATGYETTIVRLWDLHSDLAQGQPIVHRGGVDSMAFSPDSRILFTGSEDKTARFSESQSGKSIPPVLDHPAPVDAVAFSPDGKIALTCSQDGTMRLWDAAKGFTLARSFGHPSGVVTASFSPDGRTILTGHRDGTARLWDVGTGARIATPMVHQDLVFEASFSRDGKTVLTGSNDRTARVWDAASGRPLVQPLRHQDAFYAVALSPDGKTILTGCRDKRARLWNAATGQAVGKPMAHQGWVLAVAFSPDGKTAATGSLDRTARFWDSTTGEPIGPAMTHEGAVDVVAFSPDGRTLITSSRDRAVRRWQAPAGEATGPSVMRTGRVLALAFSPDSRTIVIGGHDRTCRLWDADALRPIGKPIEHQGSVGAVAFSPDGTRILTGCSDETARMWELATGLAIGPPMGHKGGVAAVAFSPDGKRAVTGSHDHTARLWDVATGEAIGQPMVHRGTVGAVAFSPDGKAVLTGSLDATARLWDAHSGQPIDPPLVHDDHVTAVAFSPNGKTVLTGSWDGVAQQWDRVTGRPSGPPMPHQGREHQYAVSALAYSPDGKTILTGSADTIRLWDSATSLLIDKIVISEGYATSAAFSPDGRRFAVGLSNQTLQLWDTPRALPDDIRRLSAWVESLTGLELDQQGAVRVLDGVAWRQRRQRLGELGGPPGAGATP